MCLLWRLFRRLKKRPKFVLDKQTQSNKYFVDLSQKFPFDVNLNKILSLEKKMLRKKNSLEEMENSSESLFLINSFEKEVKSLSQIFLTLKKNIFFKMFTFRFCSESYSLSSLYFWVFYLYFLLNYGENFFAITLSPHKHPN